MVTITRRLAQQLRTVLRRAFGNIRGKGPAIGFIAGAEGLIVRSIYGDVAIECRLPGERTTETIWLPFDFLADVAGKNDEPVDLESNGDGQVSVQWRTGKVPQIVNYESIVPFEADKFPVMPTEFAANPPGLLKSLHDAGEVTDPDAVRFATNCLQLCPDGTIKATDSRQLLIQSGFTFPWQDAVLVPRNKVFNSPELQQDDSVAVARNDDWAVVSAGQWTVYLRINKDGNFPNLSRYVLDPVVAMARCQFSKDDTRFLAETLPQLPCDEEFNYPVTLDLNGHIAIRAKAADQAKPTEVVLTNSQWTGEPIKVSMNRTYLMRAIKLGFQNLCLYGDKVALLCHADSRNFVWMPLDPESAIPAVDDAIRIESPKGELAVTVSQPAKPRRVPHMSEPTTTTNINAVSNGKASTNGHTVTNGHAKADASTRKPSNRKVALQDLAALIEDAEKLRTAAHDLMCQASGVVKGLKQHRRQNRAVQQTIAQLRTLKSLGV